MTTTRPSASRASRASVASRKTGRLSPPRSWRTGWRTRAERARATRRVRLGLELAQDRRRPPRPGPARSGRPGRRRGRPSPIPTTSVRNVARAPSRSPAARRSRSRPRCRAGGSSAPGGVGAPSYEMTRPIASVSSAAPSAHRPPYECPKTSTGPPVSAASASATAATSSNSRSIAYGARVARRAATAPVDRVDA